MANGQMGTLCFESHGFFFPNSFSNPSVCGFSFPYKPVSCLALNKRIKASSVRAASVRGVNAVQSGDSETCLATKEFIEREFKFNPMFNDYVKIMGSVQTDRSKHLSVNVEGSRPKRRSSGKDSNDVNKGNDLGEKRFGYTGKEKDSNDARVQGKKSKEFGGIKASGSGWGLVEEILEKGVARNSVYQNRGKPILRASNRALQNEKENSVNAVRDTTKYGNLENRELGDFGNNSKRQEGKSEKGKLVRNMNEVVVNNVMRRYEASKNLSDRTTSLRNVETKQYASEHSNPGIKRGRFIRTNAGKIRSEHEIGKSLLRLGNGEARMLDMDSDGKGGGKHAYNAERTFNHHGTSSSKKNRYNSSKEVHEKIRSQGDFRFQRVDSKTMKSSSKSLQTHGRIGKNDMRSKARGRDLDDVDLEDRAAFKTFEVFTDVRNRPRVLRMEMEERIQKLAKWLNATDINLPEWQFSRMMHSAQIKFTDHSILRVVQILGTFGNWKRVLQVVEWLQSRERFKSYKSRYIYTTVLDVLGKAKRPVEALNLFYVMLEELSSYPDLAAYHCIAVTLGQAGLMKELFDVIDCMRAAPKKKFNLGPLQKWDPRLEPDLVVYNAVLNACVQQKQWEGAFWVLQQLKQQGIKPSSTTYGLVMEVMLACGKYNLVYEFFSKVERTSIPSPLNYKVLVNTLWREGKADEAVSAVRDMEARGIVGYAGLYYDLARCLCTAGRCEEALLQIDKICKVAKKPLVVTYTGLIQACLNSGSIQNGAYIFNQMHKFCSPNVVTCNIMLKSYLEHGMFEEAKDLFQKILDGTHDISCKSDLRGKVVPDKFTFNTIMEACVATKNWDAFENAYLQMLQHGYHFDIKRHLRWIMDASRAGKGQLLDATWEHLVRAGRVAPPPIIKERFCMKLQEDECTAAISCLGIHENTELNAFSEDSWLNLFTANAQRFKKDTIVRLADEVSSIIAESNKPHHIFQNLLNASRKFVAAFRKNISDEHRMISCDMQVQI